MNSTPLFDVPVTPCAWLFVPADSARKIEKAAATSADALIFDLEDAVAHSNKAEARLMAREALKSRVKFPGKQLWVRINGLDASAQDALALADLAVIVAAQPDGIVLPKSGSGSDVAKLDHYLSALEAAAGFDQGEIRILAVATETAQALFTIHSYNGVTRRLAGLTWGAEDLAAALGASSNKDEQGEYLFPYQLARTMCLAGAAAAGVPSIDTVFTNFRDSAGLEKNAVEARRDGFTGKLAIHPDQVEIIQQAFLPSAEEVAEATRIVAAFRSVPTDSADSSIGVSAGTDGSGGNGGIGTVGIDGKMIDLPHYRQALKILQRTHKP